MSEIYEQVLTLHPGLTAVKCLIIPKNFKEAMIEIDYGSGIQTITIIPKEKKDE